MNAIAAVVLSLFAGCSGTSASDSGTEDGTTAENAYPECARAKAWRCEDARPWDGEWGASTEPVVEVSLVGDQPLGEECEIVRVTGWVSNVETFDREAYSLDLDWSYATDRSVQVVLQLESEMDAGKEHAAHIDVWVSDGALEGVIGQCVWKFTTAGR